ncbi:Sec-independent protein translocase protein TatB [Tianweitania sediminis]|uniref:Sec-independent protein translocase protein TatB n=1 Tax=Tianweitania sediminis TaxID=1502156 RepID=A0A8J7R4V9_9HYPH|nr:Sec-independent protein translocase protein TatB [Tianweitania sediminis]MBP0439810.1 twin-arginine translocase subunit TatB [Tianweitania sediminis]
MFELAWSEMLVIAVVMIVIVGPKDLPKMLRTFGKFAGKMSSMAGDFRKQFDEAMKEADLDDVRKSMNDLRALNPKNQIRQALSPVEQAAADIRAGADSIMRPKTPVPSTPASTEPTASEPLKNGSGVDSSIPAAASPEATAPAVAPLAPPASVAPTATLAPTASVAAPAKKPRATKAASPTGASSAPAKAPARPKAATAPKPSNGLNGASAEKPVRTRKAKETGTPT